MFYDLILLRSKLICKSIITKNIVGQFVSLNINCNLHNHMANGETKKVTKLVLA